MKQFEISDNVFWLCFWFMLFTACTIQQFTREDCGPAVDPSTDANVIQQLIKK